MFSYTEEDYEKNKIAAGLGYILFFLPLILCKDSKLGRHCANQGLLLMLVGLLANLLLSIFTGIPLLGWLFELAGGLINFAVFFIGVACFVLLTNSRKAVVLPVIGQLKILN